MPENDELKICCERLQEVLNSIKKSRDEIGRLHSELDDNVRELIEILPTFLAQSEYRMNTENTAIANLQKDIQLLTHKINILQLNKLENTAPVPQQNENCSNKFEIKQITQHNNERLATEKSHNGEEKTFENRTEATPSSSGESQPAIDVKAKTTSNNAIGEKYRDEVEKFVNDYNTRILPVSSDIKLNVLPEDKKRLSKNNFDSWNEIEDIEKICLIETSGTYSYQAQPLNIDDGRGNQYFLVAPNKLTSNFTRKTVVEDAYLAFFCFTNNGISEKGNKGKLLKPATFQKVNNFYKLVSKGEIELL